MNAFQTVVLIFFGLVVIFGLLVFSGVLPGFRTLPDGTGGVVIVWGTFPQERMSEYFSALNRNYGANFTLTYEQRDPETFESDLVNALATGKGPDLAFMPDELIMRQSDKLAPIPYETLSAEDFGATFVTAGTMLLGPSGALALPLVVDPLVMYVNRDLLTDAGVVMRPTLWSDFITPERNFTTKLTISDENNNVVRSALAFGTPNNIQNLKDILALLIIQAGNPIIELAERGTYRAVLNDNRGFADRPATAALTFFTQFADPSKTVYSWNPSLPNSKEYFSAGNLATYFGFASEHKLLRDKNPHLAIEVLGVPQRNALEQRTFGHLVTIAVLQNSPKVQTAIAAALVLANQESVTALSGFLELPPARLDLLTVEPADPVKTVFNRSAVSSRGWLDPNPEATDEIFTRMVQAVAIGQNKPTEASSRAAADLAKLLKP